MPHSETAQDSPTQCSPVEALHRNLSAAVTILSCNTKFDSFLKVPLCSDSGMSVRSPQMLSSSSYLTPLSHIYNAISSPFNWSFYPLATSLLYCRHFSFARTSQPSPCGSTHQLPPLSSMLQLRAHGLQIFRRGFLCLEFQHLLGLQNPITLFFIFCSFCMQYVNDDGALLIFHHENPKWMKELSTYFFNYNFKVGHEPWTCVNPLRLANAHNLHKTVSFTTHFLHIFILSNKSYCLCPLWFDWFVILFILYLLCRPSSSLPSYLYVFLVILLNWNACLCLFQLNINKDLLENDMNLDDDVLYNFTDASSQLIGDDCITPWRGLRKNIHCFSNVWLMLSQNPKALLQISLLAHV